MSAQDMKKPSQSKISPDTERRSSATDEDVARALEMYLRHQAFSSPLPLPRWITW